HCDLVLLDVHMPHMHGWEVLGRLRQNPPCRNLKVIMMSGGVIPDELCTLLAAGACDYLIKPLSFPQLLARVRGALEQKESQDRFDQLYQQMLTMNAELERTLGARDSDLVHVRNALVLSLAKLVECRSQESGAHLLRIQRYCTTLGEEAAALPSLADQI